MLRPSFYLFLAFATIPAVFTLSLPAKADGKHMNVHDVVRTRSVQLAQMAPEGDRIAFVVSLPRRPGVDRDGSDWDELYLVDSKGETIPMIRGNNYINQLRWSADGAQLWLLAKRPHDPFFSIYIMNPEGGEAHRALSRPNNIAGFSLHPEGKYLLYWQKPAMPGVNTNGSKFAPQIFEEQPANQHLWLMDLLQQGSEPVQITTDGHVLDAQFVGDSTNIVLTRSPSSAIDDVITQSEVSIIDITGRQLQTVGHVGKLNKVLPSPNGKKLAIIGSNDIHSPDHGVLLLADLQQPSPGVQVLLTEFDGFVTDFTWQSNRRLLFSADVGLESLIASKRVNSPGSSFRNSNQGKPIIKAMHGDGDGANIAVIAHSKSHPPELYWWRKGKLIRVSNSNPWLDNMALGEQSQHKFESRDGLQLEGVLVSPIDAKKRDALPTVIFAHGGPEAHFSDGWLSHYSHPAHVLAGMGFHSFFPNYRGSSGRGAAFLKLGQKDYAGKEFNDLLDAKSYLVKNGLSDADKVGISGVSYGGYATAWAATKFSKDFAAGVMMAGISNNISKYGTTDIPTEMERAHLLQKPWDDWQFLLQTSPIFHSGSHQTPLLIAHGKKDSRVHYSQSMELYRHLKARQQAPVRLVLYPEQGHGNGTVATRLDYGNRLVRWMHHFIILGEKTLPKTTLAHQKSTGEKQRAH